MSTSKLIRISGIQALIVFGVFCAAQNIQHPPSSVPAVSSPDSGAIVKNTYTNDFFGLKFTFPAKWFPIGEVAKDRLSDLSKNTLESSGGMSRKAADVVQKRTYNLLTVFNHAPGTPGVKRLRSEVIAGEDISYAPGVKTGKDYMLKMLPLMEKLGGEQISPGEEVQVGGKAFFRQDIRQPGTTTGSYQSYLCTVMKGYALCAIITTEDRQVTDSLAKGLSLVFEP